MSISSQLVILVFAFIWFTVELAMSQLKARNTNTPVITSTAQYVTGANCHAA